MHSDEQNAIVHFTGALCVRDESLCLFARTAWADRRLVGQLLYCSTIKVHIGKTYPEAYQTNQRSVVVWTN